MTGLNVARELPPSKLRLGFLTKTFCVAVSPSKFSFLTVGVKGGRRTGLAVVCFM